MILLFHENQGTDQQHNQGNYKTIKNQTHIWKHPIQYNHSKLGNVCISGVKMLDYPHQFKGQLLNGIKNRC